MKKSSALWKWALLPSIAAAFEAFAGTPPVGTAYTFSRPSNGQYALDAMEEDATCAAPILHYSVNVQLEAAVPVYRSQRPGSVRLFALGTRNGVRELWLGQSSPSPFFSLLTNFNDVVSITPYSVNEVLVAERNGKVSIVDGDANLLHSFSITDHFPSSFPASEIGPMVRAWRTGIHTFALLTQKHFVHFDRHLNTWTILTLNSMGQLLPGARLASFDLNQIFNGNGDDKYVWITHETFPGPPYSISLFEISTGNHIQRHVIPVALGLVIPSPVYHDSTTQKSYFAVGDDFISLTTTNVDRELPFNQLNPANLGLGLLSQPDRMAITPPAQGEPWGGSNTHWLTPAWSARNSQGSVNFITPHPVHPNPQVINSRVITQANNPLANPTPLPSVQPPPATQTAEKRMRFGVERTKDELAQYLRQEFATAVEPGDLVDSNKLVNRYSALASELRPSLLGLPDSFLNPRGLEFSGNGLQPRGAQKSPLSDWVDALW